MKINVTKNVLICGSEITNNHELLRLLKSKVNLFQQTKSDQITQIIRQKNICLLIFELSKMIQDDLPCLKSLKKNFPELLIIIVNGNGSGENIIQSFKLGVKDYFKKPYDPVLLAERIEALIRQS